MNVLILKLTIFISIFIITTRLNCQINLVPNGSFESFKTCPATLADFSVNNWFSPISPMESTPDYFNVCGLSGESGIPSNGFGFQNAFDSSAYVGIVLSTIGGGGREYIATKLSEALIPNHTYYYEFYVSVGDNSNLTSNNLGILLIDDTSNLLVDTNSWGGFNAIINDDQTIVQNEILGDTSGWLKISGNYVAHGNENYLVIGNFKLDNLTIFGPNEYNSVEAYYYVDNVFLFEINNGFIIPNVFTPNGDGINEFIDFSEFQNCRVSIVNRWGSIVHVMDSQSNFLWFGKDYLGHDLNNGVYYYIIESTFFSKTGSIHLIR